MNYKRRNTLCDSMEKGARIISGSGAESPVPPRGPSAMAYALQNSDIGAQKNESTVTGCTQARLGVPGQAPERTVELSQTMHNDSKILDIIAVNHTEVVNLIDRLAKSTQAGFDRVEARLDRIEADLVTVKSDVRDLQLAVRQIETKLDRLETRIESIEARS